MDIEQRVDDLVASDVLEGEDGRLTMTNSFTAELEQQRQWVDDASHEELATAVYEMTDRENLSLSPDDITGADEEYLSTYLALDALDLPLSPEERPAILTVFDYLRRGLPPSKLTPDSFIPVHGDAIEPLLKFSRYGLVFVWRKDCPTCEEMVDELESAYDRKEVEEDSVTQLSVYGPDFSEWLQAKYDVVGGPTTLFMLDGTIDLRLLGVHPADEIVSETQTLLSRNDSVN